MKRIIIFLLIFLLVLTSCSKYKPDSVSNNEKIKTLSKEDIENLYADKADKRKVLKITEFTGEKDLYALIEINTSPNSKDNYFQTTTYDLINLRTGNIERIPVMNAHINEIINENYMIFTTNSPDCLRRDFPHTIKVFRVRYNGGKKTATFSNSIEKKYIELSEIVDMGGTDCDLIYIGLNITGIELLFKPTIVAGGFFIPRTKVSYNKDNKSLELLMKNCTNTTGKTDIDSTLCPYIENISITQKDSDCLISIALTSEEIIYNIDKRTLSREFLQKRLTYARIDFKEKK